MKNFTLRSLWMFAFSTSVFFNIQLKAQTYCAAQGSDCAFGYITNVTIEQVNNQTACSFYANYSGSLIINVLKDSSYTLTVSYVGSGNGSAYNYLITAWIDYDHNFVFDDPAEATVLPVTGLGVHSGIITIPSSALYGFTRMRIRMCQNAAPVPCGTQSRGEVEDYGINVLSCSPGPATPGSITGPVTVCSGSTVNYSISPAANATSYSWTVPSGTIINSGGTSTSISVTVGNTSGNISVAAINTCGTSAPRTLSVTVSSTPTVTATGEGTVCAGESQQLNASGASAYSWSPVTGLNDPNISNPVATPAATTTYTVTGTAANGCTKTATVTVTVNPTLTASVASNPATCGNNDGSASVTPSGGAGAYTFLWSNGNTTSTVTGLTGQPTDTLFVTITDANGCTLTDTAIVECVTAISQTSGGLNIIISPNPSKGQFTIYNLENKTCDLNIYGMMGEKIYFDKIEHRTPARPAGGSYVVHYDFADGMYFLRMDTDSGSIMRKIVISK